MTHQAATGYIDTGKSISADGRFVVFVSWAPDLVEGDTNGAADIFVHDRQSGTVERVNVSSSGAQSNHTSWRPVISADGRYIVYQTNSTNVVPGNRDAAFILVLLDRNLGTTELVSVDRTGTHARSGADASISADGRYVAFASAASDLVDGDTNGVQDSSFGIGSSGAPSSPASRRGASRRTATSGAPRSARMDVTSRSIPVPTVL